MVDRRRIVAQWRQGRASALVTLVRAEGSSYRRPGAHLLIDADGVYSGTISGGCLEAEVVRKAAWMVRNGATVERYSTMFDDTAEMPFGLGCGGVVDLLIEPVSTPEARAFLAAMEASLAGEEAVVATWLPKDGREMARVVATDGRVLFASDGLDEDEIACIEQRCDSVTSSESLYVEKLATPQRLMVLGAGDDARPLVTMAALLGWSVTVIDGRPQWARPERFLDAERIMIASSVEGLRLATRDAVVVMTHSFEQDRALLRELLAQAQGPGYIGLLGARQRSGLLLSEVSDALGRSVAECCERVHAPVGLDLGGDGPEAIALAVIAEVQAWRNGKMDRSRRLTAEEVSVQIAQGGAERYTQVQCALEA